MRVAMNLDVYLTRAQAAYWTRVAPTTISKWHARGWRTPEGERRHLTARPLPNGNLEYRLGDLLDAERDTRNNPKSPRCMRRDDDLPGAERSKLRLDCSPRPTSALAGVDG